jgi:glycine cleavage system H lipoate-binding protein
MTAILVVLTIAAFLAVDFVLSRRRARVPARAGVAGIDAATFAAAEGVFYGPGHTWARLESDGSVRVGIDDFARRLIGRVERIDTAPEGTALDRNDAAFVIYQGEKSAGFAPPMEGVVTAVNRAALVDPERVTGDPYGDGWLVVVRPRRLAEGLRRLRVGEDAARWLGSEAARLRDFLAVQVPADAVLGATMPDGGAPVDGLLEQLDQPVWERFEAEFLAS